MRFVPRFTVLIIALLFAVLPATGVAQTATATMQVVTSGSNCDVSVYLQRTGGTAFNLGDVSLVFNYNNTALTFASKLVDGRWDDGTSAEYADQGTASYGVAPNASRSVETYLIGSTGTDVPTGETLVGTLRFTIVGDGASHNITWNSAFCYAATAGGAEVTVTYNNPSNGPLPVQLSSFTAVPLQQLGQVMLKWTTLSETNNYGFEVQKSADSAGTFITIEKSLVPGHGTTIEQHDYSFTDANAGTGTLYYRLKQIDLDGGARFTNAIRPSSATGVSEKQLPTAFALDQNYPNPFNPATSIEFALPRESRVTLEVFNLLGQRVALLLDEVKPAGYYSQVFNASSLSSGIYFYTLVAGESRFLKKMVLLK